MTRHLQNTRTRNHGCQRIVVILETEANTSPFKLMMVFNDMLRMEHQSHKSKVAGLSQERYREQIALFSFVAQSEPILANTFVGCQGLLPDLSVVEPMPNASLDQGPADHMPTHRRKLRTHSLPARGWRSPACCANCQGPPMARSLTQRMEFMLPTFGPRGPRLMNVIRLIQLEQSD